MFTGIVQAVGGIRRQVPCGGDVRLILGTEALDMQGVVLGDSIAVNGVCLAAVACGGDQFAADVSQTIAGGYRPGTRVNLEVDLVIRYLERLILGDRAADSEASGIAAAFLAEHGFLRGE